MPRRTARKATAAKIGTEIRHKYVPWDNVKDESWKTVFPETDPLVPVTLDRGTFEWLWSFVAAKGRQADAANFHYSDIHRDVYQRAANQFAVAAQEAFGDTYLAGDKAEKSAENPSEAPVEPSKPRKRRKRVSKTVETFEASESPTGNSDRKRRRKRRSRAPS